MTTRERIGELEEHVASLQKQLEFTQREVLEWQRIADNRQFVIDNLTRCPADDPDMRVLGDSLDRCREKLEVYRSVMREIKAQIAELVKWEDER